MKRPMYHLSQSQRSSEILFTDIRANRVQIRSTMHAGQNSLVHLPKTKEPSDKDIDYGK